jgi:hypothetical protein
MTLDPLTAGLLVATCLIGWTVAAVFYRVACREMDARVDLEIRYRSLRDKGAKWTE